MSNERSKTLLAIVVVGIITLLSIDKGINGDLVKFCVGGIIVLGGAEQVVDYLFKKQQ